VVCERGGDQRILGLHFTGPNAGEQMAGLVTDYMQAYGTRFSQGCVPQRVDKLPSGLLQVTWTNPQTGGQETDCFDSVLWAVGRAPEAKVLGLHHAGVEVHQETGKIVVGADESTSVPNIYAIGDVGQPRFWVCTMRGWRSTKRRGRSWWVPTNPPPSRTSTRSETWARCGATITQLQDTVGIHPTCAEELTKVGITKRSGLNATVTAC
ncbi:hypothetical protein CRUP_004746, partial [Coryphaenoides rupestris]